jgi:hypothetical protein
MAVESMLELVLQYPSLPKRCNSISQTAAVVAACCYSVKFSVSVYKCSCVFRIFHLYSMHIQ